MDRQMHLKILDSTQIVSARDTSRAVMLVGFQRHSNLGIGYLAATLQRSGYRCEVFDFEADRQKILNAAKAANTKVTPSYSRA